MTEYLTLEDLLTLVQKLDVGPVRDIGLLESACMRPQTSLWGSDAYPSLEKKGAALREAIVSNHALVYGNKRLGLLALAVLFRINGYALEGPDDDVYDLVVNVASGAHTLNSVSSCLKDWIEPFESSN